MGADARLERHRVAHQAAYPPVAVRKRVDLVESVVRRRQGRNPLCGTQSGEGIPLSEIVHEGRNRSAARRHVATDRYFVLGLRTELPRCHHEITAGAGDVQHRLGGVTIKLPVQALDEIHSDGVRELPRGMIGVDRLLQLDVGPRLHLEVPTCLVGIEVVGECPFDIPGPRVVPLDEVRVVAIHNPQEFRQAGGGSRVQTGAKQASRGGQFRQQVQQISMGLLNEAGLDAARSFDLGGGGCHLPILGKRQVSAEKRIFSVLSPRFADVNCRSRKDDGVANFQSLNFRQTGC